MPPRPDRHLVAALLVTLCVGVAGAAAVNTPPAVPTTPGDPASWLLQAGGLGSVLWMANRWVESLRADIRTLHGELLQVSRQMIDALKERP